jgi:hypothetical protein
MWTKERSLPDSEWQVSQLQMHKPNQRLRLCVVAAAYAMYLAFHPECLEWSPISDCVLPTGVHTESQEASR